MKRLFLLTVAMLMLTMTSGPTEAANGRRVYRAPNGNSPFSRMMEMERRKNAWIRRNIFGR
jgi:hypothetical protein